MKRNYLPITLIVLVAGLALAMYPQNLTVNLADEYVLLWEDSAATEPSDPGYQGFAFSTGPHEITVGYMPTLVLSNTAEAPMNATVVNTADTESRVLPANYTDSLQIYYMEETEGYDLSIEGYVVSGTPVTVNATFYHFRHMNPEYYTIYPYRFFGLGMASVGVVATAIAAYFNKSAQGKLPE